MVKCLSKTVNQEVAVRGETKRETKEGVNKFRKSPYTILLWSD